MIPGVCRVCGCGENTACLLFASPTGPRRLRGKYGSEEVGVTDVELEAYTFPCCWIEPDLCSACLEPPAPPALLFGADGQPLHRGAP